MPVDYWRVEKAASCVVITIHHNRLILPKRQYRPGIQRYTLDFCGGRCSANDPQESVPRIVKRELGLVSNDVEKAIQSIVPLNHAPKNVEPYKDDCGWIINSSFSNQLLFGYVATLQDDLALDGLDLHPISFDEDGFHLLQVLSCLQCRAVLMEWMIQQQRRQANME